VGLAHVPIDGGTHGYEWVLMGGTHGYWRVLMGVLTGTSGCSWVLTC
jgi:hypothetical protein